MNDTHMPADLVEWSKDRVAAERLDDLRDALLMAKSEERRALCWLECCHLIGAGRQYAEKRYAKAQDRTTRAALALTLAEHRAEHEKRMERLRASLGAL